MNNESMLQKDFKQRDVQRMRNLVSKKFSDKTVTQAGYTKQHIEYKEGDVWEQDGKQWTIKNGLKQTITRLDSIKKSMLIPLICPNCSKSMKNDILNKKMWPIHKMCFDCVIVMETELKRIGQYDDYVRTLVKVGVKTYINDLESALLDLTAETNESFITEQGDIEKWAGKDIDIHVINKDIQEHIQKLKDHIGD